MASSGRGTRSVPRCRSAFYRGIPSSEGRVERGISLDDDDLTVEQARQLAAALIAAADEVEQMNGYDRIEVR